jgi:hypothetical protein
MVIILSLPKVAVPILESRNLYTVKMSVVFHRGKNYENKTEKKKKTSDLDSSF